VRTLPTMALPPWKKSSGRPATGRKLTPENIAWAKARARKAGRRYPNLIDNMAAAQRQAGAERPKSSPGRDEDLRP
jgi:hypothetical protein